MKEALTIPVLANGDIRNLDDIERCLAHTGCDGVMSADPLLGNPALFDAELWQTFKSSARHEIAENENQMIAFMAPYQCCDLLREYLSLCKEHAAPFRMVKAHSHKMLGAWFREFTDLRDEMNTIGCGNIRSGERYIGALDAVDSITVRVRERIVSIVESSGRVRPIPAPKDKEKIAAEKLAARENAIRLQKEEEEALNALDAKKYDQVKADYINANEQEQPIVNAADKRIRIR